jgi:predicted glutamine amidotransferase
MCKLIGISSLGCKSVNQVSGVVRESAKLLGATQKHGFGYAIKTSKGTFMERYLNPENCKGVGVVKQSRDILPVSIKTQLAYGTDYDQFGPAPEKGKLQGCYISHGRTATCDRVISNTHPFNGFHEGKEWTIAHNGVVDWNGEKWETKTTCDSEHILNCFLYGEGEHSFSKGLSGYAAVLGINPNGEMFCLRDDRAPLYISMIQETGQYVICTDSTHNTEITKLLASYLDIKKPTITTPLMLEAWVKHTFHANGEVSSNPFNKFSSYSPKISSSSVSTSLGSAGVGYGSTYGSYYGNDSLWDDTVDRAIAKDLPVSEHEKKVRSSYLRNAHKPWKHNK